MERNQAQRTMELMTQVSMQMNDCLLQMRGSCTEAEFRRYRSAFGRVLGEILLGIINPIAEEYPDLRPAGLE